MLLGESIDRILDLGSFEGSTNSCCLFIFSLISTSFYFLLCWCWRWFFFGFLLICLFNSNYQIGRGTILSKLDKGSGDSLRQKLHHFFIWAVSIHHNRQYQESWYWHDGSPVQTVIKAQLYKDPKWMERSRKQTKTSRIFCKRWQNIPRLAWEASIFLAYLTSICSLTGTTPYSLVYGMEAVLLIEMEMRWLRILMKV